MATHRIIVYPSDFQNWSDKKGAAAYRNYIKTRQLLDLNKDQPLTIFHLRDLWKIPLEDIINSLTCFTVAAVSALV